MVLVKIKISERKLKNLFKVFIHDLYLRYSGAYTRLNTFIITDLQETVSALYNSLELTNEDDTR